MADQPYTEDDVARLRHVIVMPSEVVPRAYDREPYPQWAARAILADLAAAGRLLPEGASRQVWILGTDYADDEIFGVAATREEVEAIKRRVGDHTDPTLNPVLYSLPYPSASQDQGSTDE
jgi:hypothetical protein